MCQLHNRLRIVKLLPPARFKCQQNLFPDLGDLKPVSSTRCMLVSVWSNYATGIIPVKIRALLVKMRHFRFYFLILVALCSVFSSVLPAFGASRRMPLALKSGDVLPTGNEWVALPDIRTVDGALGSFNVISIRCRGLFQLTGDRGAPALQPYFMAGDKLLAFRNPSFLH